MAGRSLQYEQEKRKRQLFVRRRFKTFMRKVSTNRVWLQDFTTATTMTMNVRRNIAMVVRKHQQQGILSMQEKAILRTPAVLRSVEQRKKLLQLVLGLPCLANFNPKIRARLAPHLEFQYFHVGRVAIREGGLPMCMYFMCSGEIEMINATTVDKSGERLERICGPGDCFGEVELLENCRRRHTYICSTVAEVLMLSDDHFDEYLRPYMTRQWNQKKAAIQTLSYFEGIGRQEMLTACQLCELRQYEPNDVISAKDEGYTGHAYFVLSGECMILQKLKLKVSQLNGKCHYELAKIQAGDTDTKPYVEPQPYFQKWIENYKNSQQSYGFNEAESDTSDEETKSTQERRRQSLREIRKHCAHLEEHSQLAPEKDSVSTECNELAMEGSFEMESGDIEASESGSETVSGLSIFSDPHEAVQSSTSVYSVRKQEAIEYRFMDVGTIRRNGVFGIGEKRVGRIISARNTVQCLLMPRFWLSDPGQGSRDAWSSRTAMLDHIIPSREEVFKIFLAQRGWQIYAKNLLKHVIKKPRSSTKPEDVTIMTRILENFE